MSANEMAMPRHPLREPMVWLVIALPLAAVIAGLTTLGIAIRHHGDDAMPESVHRVAQIQTRDLGVDAAARAAGLAMLLVHEPHALRVERLAGELGQRQPLVLWLRHPVDGRFDRRVMLEPGAGGWTQVVDVPGGHDWRLELISGDGHWRLVGRLPAGSVTARLEPSLAVVGD